MLNVPHDQPYRNLCTPIGTHRIWQGAARVTPLPKDVCSHPYAPGLDEGATRAVLGASGNLITPRLVSQVPRVTAEPPVRAYARRAAD